MRSDEGPQAGAAATGPGGQARPEGPPAAFDAAPEPPSGAGAEARLLLTARALRAFADGLVSLILPAYLLALGYGPLETGVIATATLAGSALLTLLIGAYAHRASGRRLLIAASSLMIGPCVDRPGHARPPRRRSLGGYWLNRLSYSSTAFNKT